MIKRIVCPVDFSAAACRAADYAVNELSPATGAEVVLVTVLEPSDLRVAMNAGLHGFDSDAELHAQVQQWIEQQFAKITAGKAEVKRDVRRGLPEREIVEAIQERKADLVVMGAVGIARRFPMGSKAEYVLRNCDVPLVLIKAADAE